MIGTCYLFDQQFYSLVTLLTIQERDAQQAVSVARSPQQTQDGSRALPSNAPSILWQTRFNRWVGLHRELLQHIKEELNDFYYGFGIHRYMQGTEIDINASIISGFQPEHTQLFDLNHSKLQSKQGYGSYLHLSQERKVLKYASISLRAELAPLCQQTIES
jgi:hypothetical protein